jgi:exonuclease SbcD
VVLTDPQRPAQAKLRLERRFPHLLSLGFEPEGRRPAGVPAARTGAGLTDHEVTLEFVRELRERPADEVESALLRDACDACCDDPDLDRGVVA